MSYACEVVLDSISPAGDRLTTLVVTAHADALRKISQCRALHCSFVEDVRPTPLVTAMQAAKLDPFVPRLLGASRDAWLIVRDNAVLAAFALSSMGIDNQVAKRLLAPFLWETAVVSGTTWNFVPLCRDDSEDVRTAADIMIEALRRSEPKSIKNGFWHRPSLEQAYGVQEAGHCAQATDRPDVAGPFKGWQQAPT